MIFDLTVLLSQKLSMTYTFASSCFFCPNHENFFPQNILIFLSTQATTVSFSKHQNSFIDILQRVIAKYS